MTKIQHALQARLKKTRGKKGFTLIELVVVILIIGVLMAILVPNLIGYVNDAKLTAADANARQVFTAAQAHLTSTGATGTGSITDNDVLAKYLGSSFDGSIFVSYTNGTVTAAFWSNEMTISAAPTFDADGKVGGKLVGKYDQ